MGCPLFGSPGRFNTTFIAFFRGMATAWILRFPWVERRPPSHWQDRRRHGGSETMRRLLLVPAFGVAALALTAPVQAQTRGWLDNDRAYSAPAQQSFYDSGRGAYDNGFREGLK